MLHYLFDGLVGDTDFARQILPRMIREGIETHLGIKLNAHELSIVASYAAATLDSLEAEGNQKFFAHHFKKVKALSTETERHAYLSELPAPRLEKLRALTKGGGPTSLSIQRLASRIEWKRGLKETPFILAIFLGVTFLMTPELFTGRS